MKKLKCAFMTVFLAIGCYLSVVNAYGDTVRVGLEKSFKNISQITINDDIMEVGIGEGDKYNISGTYTVKPVTGTYYNTDKYFSTYAEANKGLGEYTGFSCIPALTDKGWTIYVRTDGKKLNNASVINTGNYCVGFAVDGNYKFIADGSSPIRVNSKDGVIGVGSGNYRDEIEIYRKENTLTAINIIDEEKYLYGVINSEMPSSWSKEAQKAQAVAARTYLERNKGKHNIYDVCDGVHCQDYNGTSKETEQGIAAVNETKGLCIYYDNSPIDAVYFSSDGGATFDGADVWGNDTPYLKGKADIYEKEYKEWERKFTYSELTNMCAARGYNIGNVITVSAQYNENGLVKSLTFNGSQGQKTITNDEIRTAFSSTNGGSLFSRNFIVISGEQVNNSGNSVYIIDSKGVAKEADNNVHAQNKDGRKGPLGSSFVIESSNGSQKLNSGENSTAVGTPGTITFIGKGNGHNAGMSQYGAKGMAEAGYSFTDILKFYYTGVEIK